VTDAPEALTRTQILSYRRRAGALDARLAAGPDSLRRAAWAGLQDSMPRAAVLSMHARVEGGSARAWADPSLVQLWGPRFSVFVVAAVDRAIFSVGTLPDHEQGRRRAWDLAARLRDALGGREMPCAAAGRALGVHPNRLRYASATGTVLIRWDGARQPAIRSVPAPDMEPREARLELARRYLHAYGPTTPQAFAQWAGIGVRRAVEAFTALGSTLVAVRTPMGEAAILGRDAPACRTGDGPEAAARLLPSGDRYLLLHGRDRELLVPDAAHRAALWPPRVWPGGVLVRGELVGTWRRAQAVLTVTPWRRLSRTERELVEAEAHTLPLPLAEGQVEVRWQV
jgi:hypothetical protein